MDPDSSALRVIITDGRGRAARAPGLAAWLARIAPAAARGDVAIALVSDARIRALNRQYRGQDTPTDVLSFGARGARGARGAAGAVRPPHSSHPPHLAPHPALGDIVIAAGVARRQAREAGHSYALELRVLALHGLLHLLGYDHHSSADRNRMARLERRLRTAGGLQAGLIERSRMSPARPKAGWRTAGVSGAATGAGWRRRTEARRRDAEPRGARSGRAAKREH